MARLRGVGPATSAALKLLADVEAVCRSHRLVLTHEADKPWDVARTEPAAFVPERRRAAKRRAIDDVLQACADLLVATTFDPAGLRFAGTPV